MIKPLQRIKQSLKTKKESIPELSTSGEGYIEINPQPVERETNIFVRYCSLDTFEDIKSILDYVRDGTSISIVKIKQLKEKDINELKRAISKIKKVAEVMNGDVMGMDEDYILVTPSFVKVTKAAPSPKTDL